MCPAGIRMRVDMMRWPQIAVEFHGMSSHTGRIKTIRKEIFVYSKVASAWITALSMFSGSYFELAIQSQSIGRERSR